MYSVAPVITPVLTGTVAKVYDATSAATLNNSNYTYTGAIDGDTVVLNNPVNGTYDNPDVGTNKNVSVVGIALVSASDGSAIVYGYQLGSTTANANIGIITPAPLTISNVIANSKLFDGNTAATLNLSAATFNGVLAGDTVDVSQTGYVANFITKNPANNIPAIVSSIVLTGASASNYALVMPTDLFASIFPTSVPPTVPPGSVPPGAINPQLYQPPSGDVSSLIRFASPIIEISRSLTAPIPINSIAGLLGLELPGSLAQAGQLANAALQNTAANIIAVSAANLSARTSLARMATTASSIAASAALASAIANALAQLNGAMLANLTASLFNNLYAQALASNTLMHLGPNVVRLTPGEIVDLAALSTPAASARSRFSEFVNVLVAWSSVLALLAGIAFVIISAKLLSLARLHVVSKKSFDMRTDLNDIVGFSEVLNSGKLGPLTIEQRDYLKEILDGSKQIMAELGKIENQVIEVPDQIMMYNLRSALNDINGYADFLSHTPQLTNTQKDCLKEILRGSKHMSGLINT